jgi:hypothetical protein
MTWWCKNSFLNLFILLGGVFLAAASAVPSVQAQPGARDQSDGLQGEWRNMNGTARIIRRVVIQPSDSGVRVHVWGDCGGRECDWGVKQANVYNGAPGAVGEPKIAIQVKFDLDVSVSHLIIMRNPRNQGLVVQVFNREQGGRDHGPDEIKPVGGDTYSIERFEKTGAAPARADTDRTPDPRDRTPDPRDRRPDASDAGRYDERNRRDDSPDGKGGRYEAERGGDDRRGDPYAVGDREWRHAEDRYGRDSHQGDPYRDDPKDRGDDRSGENRGDWRNGGVHEDCVRFDPDRLDLARSEGRWRISEGRRWLFDFSGPREDAEQALDVIRYYRADQSCRVGRSGAGHWDGPFTYLLRGGEAPSGHLGTEDCERFDPDKARVRRIDGSYRIAVGNRPLFDFGAREDEAQQALEIIHKHGFGASCYAGRSEGGLRYLRR